MPLDTGVGVRRGHGRAGAFAPRSGYFGIDALRGRGEGARRSLAGRDQGTGSSLRSMTSRIAWAGRRFRVAHEAVVGGRAQRVLRWLAPVTVPAVVTAPPGAGCRGAGPPPRCPSGPRQGFAGRERAHAVARA